MGRSQRHLAQEGRYLSDGRSPEEYYGEGEGPFVPLPDEPRPPAAVLTQAGGGALPVILTFSGGWSKRDAFEIELDSYSGSTPNYAIANLSEVGFYEGSPQGIINAVVAYVRQNFPDVTAEQVDNTVVITPVGASTVECYGIVVTPYETNQRALEQDNPLTGDGILIAQDWNGVWRPGDVLSFRLFDDVGYDEVTTYTYPISFLPQSNYSSDLMGLDLKAQMDAVPHPGFEIAASTGSSISFNTAAGTATTLGIRDVRFTPAEIYDDEPVITVTTAAGDTSVPAVITCSNTWETGDQYSILLVGSGAANEGVVGATSTGATPEDAATDLAASINTLTNFTATAVGATVEVLAAGTATDVTVSYALVTNFTR